MGRPLYALLVVFLFVSNAIAQEEKETPPKTDPVAKVSQTEHEVVIDGKTIPLVALTGTLKLKDENNEPIALYGFTYYAKTPQDRSRPIVFAYNGGPGSSSYWLHMGVLGPKRIVVNDPDFTPAAPYKIENNPSSILDIADLVMIDPVGTGLSVPIGESKFEDFWGVDQDINSVSNFITQFLIENNRMNSPKYILGESYGTFRNAGVMNRLLRQGIALNGVVMVSAVFDIRTLTFPPDDDLPYILHLPTYAATARYHNQLEDPSESLEAFLDRVRAFTEDTYAPALFKGDRLSNDDKQKVASELAAITGLNEQYWLRANLRVKASEFFQELLREEGKTVGRLDSRFIGPTQDLLSQNAAYDPQSLAISPAFTTGFLDYLYNDLRVDRDLKYMLSAGRREGFKWDFERPGSGGFLGNAIINTGPDMAQAMSRDPNLKVLILNGYYDIATVFYGVEYSIDHLGLDAKTRDNIIMKYYEAGHMMYTHQPSLEKFKKDVAEFILSTSNSE